MNSLGQKQKPGVRQKITFFDDGIKQKETGIDLLQIAQINLRNQEKHPQISIDDKDGV